MKTGKKRWDKCIVSDRKYLEGNKIGVKESIGFGHSSISQLTVL